MRLILAVLALGLACAAAQAQPTPRQLIAQLGLETRPGDGRDWTRQREAEKAVARQLRRLIADKPDDPGLTETDAYRRTPLMEAAVNGYADVVEALLSDAGVRAGIDDRDRFGATAWALSQFARPVTLIACHPRMYTRERLPLLKPYARRIAYFREGDTTSFTRIARQLVAAGSRADAAAAKAAWLAQCPETEDALRQRLQLSDDLPGTLWGYTFERLQQFKRDMESSATQLAPTLALNPLLPGVNAGDAYEQRWPRVSVPRADGPAPDSSARIIRCSRMDKPEITATNWIGEATFRLIVELQAGVPTVVDIRLTSGRLEPGVQATLQAGMLRTLASYECAGDHIFEQEFQYKIQ